LRGARITALAAVGFSLTPAATGMGPSSGHGPIAGQGLSGLALLFIAGTPHEYWRALPPGLERGTIARASNNLEAPGFLLGFMLSGAGSEPPLQAEDKDKTPTGLIMPMRAWLASARVRIAMFLPPVWSRVR
jgi:hypothetical protein